MCGRFTLTVVEGLPPLFEIDDHPGLRPRYNIAPTQEVAVVCTAADGKRSLQMMQWGLIPAWAQEPAASGRLINARSETADRKPAFREAFRQRRCLIPADGFFEWRKEAGVRQPFYFCRADRGLFAFAGLWEGWEGGESSLSSCSILTTSPNRLVEPVHDRMPAILPRNSYAAWLDPSLPVEVLKRLLGPCPASEMAVFPVSRLINSPRHDGPECIRPIGQRQGQGNQQPTLFDL